MSEGERARVVIGELSPMVGKILRDKLVREGHDVEWLAETGAIETCLRERPPHLLIINAMLPEEDGLRIMEATRGSDGALPYPVILTFEQALYPEEAERLAALRPTALLPMPFKPTEVAAVVKRLLGPAS